MKTFDKIFDAIDNIFKVVVMFLFGAMVLGFASCSDNDEDENDCKRNYWVDDSDLAEAYAELNAHGYDVEKIWICGVGGDYLHDIPNEKEASEQFNLIVEGFNYMVNAKEITPNEYLTMFVQATKCVQEQTFGVQMFSMFYWNGNENVFKVYFNNYCGVINYNENSFKLTEIIEATK
ncbi:MAG: hypothetical protein MJ060_04595 [Clostridia bacterium]|nr:hypothetical protein [Clostridia bacterium]